MKNPFGYLSLIDYPSLIVSMMTDKCIILCCNVLCICTLCTIALKVIHTYVHMHEFTYCTVCIYVAVYVCMYMCAAART